MAGQKTKGQSWGALVSGPWPHKHNLGCLHPGTWISFKAEGLGVPYLQIRLRWEVAISLPARGGAAGRAQPARRQPRSLPRLSVSIRTWKDCRSLPRFWDCTAPTQPTSEEISPFIRRWAPVLHQTPLDDSSEQSPGVYTSHSPRRKVKLREARLNHLGPQGELASRGAVHVLLPATASHAPSPG